MRKIHRIILSSLAVVIGSCLFASQAYPGSASNGIWDQLHVAVFSESSGDVGTQIGGDDEAYTVGPGSKLFVVIQADFTTQSKDQAIEISWRAWGGSWAVASPKGAGSATDWEFWNSNYASLDAATIHFTGSNGAVYLEDDSTDANDPKDLEEFWFVVEAPTTEGRYELAISEDGVVTGGQGTISQQCDITVAAVTLADHAAGQQGSKFIGSSITGAQLFGFQLTNNTAGQLTVDQVQFQLSSVTGIVEGDFTESELKIYEDTNGDGDIGDGESTTVGGTGDVNAGVTTITFGTDFTISAGATVNYILKGDVSNLEEGDKVTIDLGTSNVTLTPAGDVGGSDATSVTHTYCEENAYSYQRSIVIDHTLVGTDNSGTLPATGFPVLVSLSGDWLKTTTEDPTNGRIESDDGWDIIFKRGSSTLYHEIEEYDGTNGTLMAWVKVDSLSKETDTSIYMLYGNPCVSSTTEDPENVWDDNFKGVWHLKEATDATNMDSTKNSNDGTPVGNPTNPTQVTGKISGALDFNLSEDGTRIDIPADASLDLTLYNNWTLSAWVKPTSYVVRSGQWSLNTATQRH